MVKETAQQIRADLKAAGYKARDISVRCNNIGYSSAVRITIKKANIRKSDIEAIAKKYENIDRCDISGEILLGGNTYIFVDYDNDVFNHVYENYLEIAEDFIENHDKYPNNNYKFGKELILIFSEKTVILRQENKPQLNYNFYNNPYLLAKCLCAYDEFKDIRWWF